MGKGDTYRPVNKRLFDENYEAIFGHADSKHSATDPPTVPMKPKLSRNRLRNEAKLVKNLKKTAEACGFKGERRDLYMEETYRSMRRLANGEKI